MNLTELKKKFHYDSKWQYKPGVNHTLRGGHLGLLHGPFIVVGWREVDGTCWVVLWDRDTSYVGAWGADFLDSIIERVKSVEEKAEEILAETFAHRWGPTTARNRALLTVRKLKSEGLLRPE